MTVAAEAQPGIFEKATLGQRVKFDATFKRNSHKNAYPSRDYSRTWDVKPCEEREGVVVGVRTIWDGSMNYEEHGEDTVSYFVFGDKHQQALLVAFAMNRNPALVPLANATAA